MALRSVGAAALLAVLASSTAAQQRTDTSETKLRTLEEGYCVDLALDTTSGQVVAPAYRCERKGFDINEEDACPLPAETIDRRYRCRLLVGSPPIDTIRIVEARRNQRCRALAERLAFYRANYKKPPKEQKRTEADYGRECSDSTGTPKTDP